MRHVRDFSTAPRRARLATWELVLVLVGLLALGLVAREAWGARSALAAAQRSVEGLRREVEGDRAAVRALESGPWAGDRFAAPALLGAEAEPREVVAELAALLPPDVRLDALSLAYGERLEVDMQVAAKGAAAYDRFLHRLTESPRIRDVRPGAENREGEVRASVRALYVPRP